MAIRKISSRSIGTDVITAEDLAANSVTVAEIQDGAVTAPKIGTGAVTVDKLGTGAVTADKVGTGAVTVDKLGTGAVTADKVESNIALPGTTATINGYTPTASNMAGRNRIINGDFRVAQRGTVVTPVNGYTLDRWQNIASGVGTVTVSQDTDTPNANIKNSLKIDVTGAVTSQQLSIAVSDKYAMRQQIEGLNVSDLGFGSATAKTVTVSFWVKSPKSGVHNIALCNSGSTRAYVADYTIALADTWEQFSITIAGDTSGTWLTTNGIGLVLHFNLSAGSNTQTAPGVWTAGNFTASSNAITTVLDNIANNFFLANVQLETGPTATEFEYRSYGTELALCQRYYYKNAPTSVGNVGLALGFTINNTTAQIFVTYPVQMRATPTTSTTNTLISDNVGYDLTVSGTTNIQSSLTSAYVGITFTAWNSYSIVYRPCLLRSLSSGVIGFIDFTSEL
jgi:hypothetical protein